jgi:hypothetical protein
MSFVSMGAQPGAGRGAVLIAQAGASVAIEEGPKDDAAVSSALSALLKEHDGAGAALLLTERPPQSLTLALAPDWHPDARCDPFFGALGRCAGLRTLSLCNSWLAGRELERCIFEPLAGHGALESISVASTVPLWGPNAAHTLVVALEALGRCTALRTLRLDGPAFTGRHLRDALRLKPFQDRDAAPRRLREALAGAALTHLSLHGHVFTPAMADALFDGVGAHPSLRELDLAGCGLIANDLPRQLRSMSANLSLQRVTPPAPGHLLFRLPSGLSMLYADARGHWSVHRGLPRASAELFEGFEGGGDAWLRRLPKLSLPWNMRRQLRAQDPATRRQLAHVLAAFLAMARDTGAGQGEALLTPAGIYLDISHAMVQDIVEAGSLNAIVRLTQVSRGVEARRAGMD